MLKFSVQNKRTQKQNEPDPDPPGPPQVYRERLVGDPLPTDPKPSRPQGILKHPPDPRSGRAGARGLLREIGGVVGRRAKSVPRQMENRRRTVSFKFSEDEDEVEDVHIVLSPLEPAKGDPEVKETGKLQRNRWRPFKRNQDAGGKKGKGKKDTKIKDKEQSEDVVIVSNPVDKSNFSFGKSDKSEGSVDQKEKDLPQTSSSQVESHKQLDTQVHDGVSDDQNRLKSDSNMQSIVISIGNRPAPLASWGLRRCNSLDFLSVPESHDDSGCIMETKPLLREVKDTFSNQTFVEIRNNFNNSKPNPNQSSQEQHFDTLPRMTSKRSQPLIIQDGDAQNTEKKKLLPSAPRTVERIQFLKRLNGLVRNPASYKSDGEEDDADHHSSSSEDESETRGDPDKSCSRFLSTFTRTLDLRSSVTSRTSDLSTMSRGSSSQKSDSFDGRDLRDTSYLVHSPSQDSSSGIASDEHNAASATSESSPTYDLLESKPKVKVNLLKRYPGSRHQCNDQDDDSDYVDLDGVVRRTGYMIQKHAEGQHSKNVGYHETNLDDPESDSTFVFPESRRRQQAQQQFIGHRRGCDSAPTLPIPAFTSNAQHLRTSTPPVYSRYTTEYGVIQNKHKLSYFEILPDDLILQIFKRLPTDQVCRCARVCRRWYNLAWDPVLWTSIRINDSTVDADKAIRTLTKRLSYETPTVCAILERVSLSGCERLTDKGLYMIARRCSELRHLDLQGCCNISNIALFEVVSCCVNLEHLNVAGCADITCICLTPEATVQAATYGKQIDLRYLDMTDCYNLVDSGLQIIASYCTRLTYLYLRRCTGVTDIGVQYVANYCTSLKELSISDCHGVTDFGMRELSKLGSNLRYLSVAKCEKISDVGIRYIARYCTRLRYLNVRGCEGVSDDSIEMLARCCTRLRSLDVGKCDITDDGLQSLAQYTKQLKKLSLKACDGITDQGIFDLAQHCRGLHQLNIQDCHLSIEAYRAVKRYCKRCIIEHTNPGFY